MTTRPSASALVRPTRPSSTGRATRRVIPEREMSALSASSGGPPCCGSHATLVRQLETDLDKECGLALADLDVLAQLARASGSYA
jgi:hypothetical protein